MTGHSPRRGLLWALVAVVLWSPLAALALAALRTSPVIVVLLWAYLAAAAAATLLHRCRGGRWRTAFLGPPRLIVVGLLGSLGWFGGTILALHRGPAVQANLITYLWPLLVVLLAPLAREPFRRLYLLAVILGLTGTVIVVTGGHTLAVNAGDAYTYLIATGAALSWALYTVLLRRHGRGDQETALFLNWSLVLTAVTVAVTGQFSMPSLGVLAACAAIGAGSLALAFLAWDRAIALAGVGRVGIFANLDPLLSTLFLVVILGEPLTWPTAVGGAVIIAGIAVAEAVPAKPAALHTDGSRTAQPGALGRGHAGGCRSDRK